MPVTKKNKNKKPPLKKTLKKLLNGFVIGNADNDPAGISTYTIAGAQTGFSLILFNILSIPLLINTQAICARIGDVTKKGLASVIKLYYGKPIAVITMFLVIIGNILTLGADFAMIAASFHLLIPQLPTLIFLPILALLLWYLVVFKSYRILSQVLAGLGIVFLSYIATAFLIKPDWLEIGQQILFPQLQLTPNLCLIAVAMMGTTITPFLFYWQVTEEIEDRPSVHDVQSEIGQVSWGLVFAGIVSTFIIITSALTLYPNQIVVGSAFEAASVLKPLAGDLAYLLFSLGIIGSGMLVIPVLSSVTAYTVAETFDWRAGLNHKLNQAKGFYGILTLSFIIGLALTLMKINPIKMLFYSQVVNGLISPIILAFILKIATKEVIMKKYTIGNRQKIIGWLTVLIMILAGVGIFLT